MRRKPKTHKFPYEARTFLPEEEEHEVIALETNGNLTLLDEDGHVDWLGNLSVEPTEERAFS